VLVLVCVCCLRTQQRADSQCQCVCLAWLLVVPGFVVGVLLGWGVGCPGVVGCWLRVLVVVGGWVVWWVGVLLAAWFCGVGGGVPACRGLFS
jgi:hypothetical protein